MREIRNKWVLVTGAAMGIGRAIALRLAREGARLFLVDIDEVRLRQVVEHARDLGAEVMHRRCDVGDPREVSAVVAELMLRCGGVDILVNNAGITYYGKTDRMSAEHWDRLMRINLLSHVQFTRELLPTMLERREAHVLNVCSVLGLVGMPKVTAYCTSKFGMVGFTEALRNEFGREGLGVTALCPGFVTTNLFTNAPLEKSDCAGSGDPRTTHKVPPRIVCTTPERVAEAAVKAIYRNRRLVTVEPFAKFMYAMKRYTPWLIDFIFHRGRRKRVAKKMAPLEKAA